MAAAKGRDLGEARGRGGYPLPDLDTAPVGLIEVNSLNEQAYYIIRDQIIRLQLGPGRLLNERELGERLAIGRTPIRDALRRLADEGFVEIYPRQGALVTSIQIGDLVSIGEVRTDLEGSGARLAAQRASDREREQLHDLALNIGRFDTDDPTQVMRADQTVHSAIYACTRNVYLQRTLEDYWLHSVRFWYLQLDKMPQLKHSIEDHLAILAAVIARDSDAAETNMRNHVLAAQAAWRGVL